MARHHWRARRDIGRIDRMSGRPIFRRAPKNAERPRILRFELRCNAGPKKGPHGANLRHERFVPASPLNPSLPPLLTHPQAAAVRHKRSIVVSMAEGIFCTGHAEIRLIQIRMQAAFRGD